MANTQDYNGRIQAMRAEQFPMLGEELYLDHAGTTLYSKGLLDRFHTDMISDLYGNPHSASSASLRSTEVIDQVRLEALKLFDADPEVFDLVFTANTSAAIKLVADVFREQPGGFRYCYHADSHTSLVGVRELSTDHFCFENIADLDDWLEKSHGTANLFAFPAQSNLNGRRLPLGWCSRTQSDLAVRTFSLLDAAAFASTSPIRLNDAESAPDFTVVSFAKIFGFPDLGGLIIKKSTEQIFKERKYFGGGTVDMVVCLKEQWHIKKSNSLHDQLEDGTLPIHNILALRSAMRTHSELFQSFQHIADHTNTLAQQLYLGLSSLKYENGKPVCLIYKSSESMYGDLSSQGPVVAFNIQTEHGTWVSNAEVEKLSSIKKIHLRTGGLCNPGGIASNLDLAPWEMRDNFSSGFRCGSENDILNGKPTGVIRVSLGAMSTEHDVDRFLCFIREFFTSSDFSPELQLPALTENDATHRLYVESLTVYPIKSCSGWQIPHDKAWEIHSEGLAWDREWCIVKQHSGTVLSQKNNPVMALIRPELDFDAGVLRVRLAGNSSQITIPLSHDPQPFNTAISAIASRTSKANVCGETIQAQIYTSSTIVDFFTSALGLPCTLARFPPASRNRSIGKWIRHGKPHLLPLTSRKRLSSPAHPLLLSNESPILTISRSSLNRLNETIKSSGGQAVRSAVFRANIVLAEDPRTRPGTERAWAEDSWTGMRIGRGRVKGGRDGNEAHGVDTDGANAVEFDFLGGCRRCQMVCVNPENGNRNQEPFVTLAKTRRFRGRVLFGVHTALAPDQGGIRQSLIRVGDVAVPFTSEELT